MTFRCFPVASILYGILFCGHFASAEVVQAYRTPSDADLQWLLGDAPASIPSVASPSMIVQAGHFVPKMSSDPCRPVGLPNPPIPPAPKVGVHKMNIGLVADEEGVATITSTVLDASAVVQMSGDRIPPPSEVPKEQDPIIALPAAEPEIERLPMPGMPERPLELPRYSNVISGYGSDPCCPAGSCNDFGKDVSSCFCSTCTLCGDHRKKCRHSADAPDMIGSSAWLTGYHVGINTPSTQFTLPTMLLTRPNVGEHFNASVQNRIWADYHHWNNAVSVNKVSRAVEQFSFGLEKKILQSSSVEFRLPLLYQFGSGLLGSTSGAVELGNVSVFAKQVLVNGSRWTISGGGGVLLPTAENWRPFAGARLENNAYYLVSFLGAQWHPNSSTFGHFLVQADVPIEKNKLVFNNQSAKVSGQQVIRTGVQLGQWIYRADHGKRPCRFGVFAEVDYAVVTEGSSLRGLSDVNNDIYVDAFPSRKSTLTMAAGMPMVFGKLTCTNSLILPISGTNRPFDACYNFSLSRQF